MAGFPLAAIGAGIGQGIQQIDQHTMAAIQQAVARLALQQQQQQQQAQMLAGSALPGLTGMMRPGGLNLPGSTMQPAAQTSPLAPPPTAMPPLPAVAPNQSSAGQFDAGDDGTQSSLGTAGDNMTIPLDTPATDRTQGIRPPSAEAADRIAAGQSPAPSQQDAPAPTQMQAPITNPSVQGLIGPQVDLGQIVQAIQKARPDADPGTVFRATTMLYEMLEKGNAAQMNTAIRAYTQLRLADQFKQTLPIRQQQADTARQSVEQRGQIAAGVTPSGAPTVAEKSRQDRAAGQSANREIAKQRLDQQKTRDAAIQARADAAAARGDRNTARAIYNSQINAWKAQLNPPLGSQQPDDATRAWLQKQIDEAVNKLSALEGQGTAPARPQPAPPQ